MTIIDWVAKSTGLPAKQVKAAIELIEAGNTLPFIARYRKEVTDGLTDEQLEKIFAAWEKAKALEKRKEAVRRSLAEQKILTPALERALHAASTLAEVEDIYAPFRPKRKTRASIAKEKGLEGLAQSILRQTTNVRPEKLISEFVGEKVATAEEAVAGAKDIIAEFISNAPQVRKRTRDVAAKKGIVRTSRTRKGTDAKGTYQDYYDFSLDIGKIKPHQVLAINRAESEKVISFRLDLASDEWKRVIEEQIKVNPKSPLAKYLQAAIEDAGERLLMPNIERDIRRLLTEQAEEHAIQVFTENLRNLLLQPPITGKVVMGIDPGYRTGCKVAVVDATGRVLDTEAIYPHEPQKNAVEAARTLCSLILKHKVDLIAIGNGTASRETEMLVAEIIKQMPGVKYLIANEAGASVYSASVLARKELPNLDVSMRGAVSIARRVQDPLAELVKIDPKSIGVGMYQHDVDQKKLGEAVRRVVTAVVARVGVDVNTASPALLAYVPGIGEKLAQNIVAYRDAHGAFNSRKELKKVAGMGNRAFEQSVGFLRIYGGKEPLDGSAIHPENYKTAKEILKLANITMGMPVKEKRKRIDQMLKNHFSLDELAELLEVGKPTLTDILEQLVQPGRDPRQDLPKPVLRSGILTLEELQPGMTFQGTVRNVTDFGAFIDIGLKSDALLHKSRFPQGKALKVGDVVQAEVETVDKERGRVGLTM